jgi:hypothetical protein
VNKISTGAANRSEIFKEHKLTIGVDLGDRSCRYCILDEAGEVILEPSFLTTIYCETTCLLDRQGFVVKESGRLPPYGSAYT